MSTRISGQTKPSLRALRLSSPNRARREWLPIRANPLGLASIPKALKEEVMKEYSYMCAICGKGNPQLHHIDGENMNNVAMNLIPLCSNHHLIDLVNDTHRLSLMNAMLHNIDGEITLGDTLSNAGKIMKGFDVVLTNPPFGTKRAVNVLLVMTSYILHYKPVQTPGGFE
ncbi:hypothetical protein SBF1_4740005 [Candidatus Desulfosporosinus infrequens]|uniref:site-specific DNA-methyltransferase (adenine-specific) n=1 Tax=Candidatus Desulfosporosinus infrequens TaxID=2043169 RepID=A0A2U3LET6_9FIRM|nr:hypothetical protein SBF1_4740005 [Candidatus Desulfosporosinus infrequens]